MENVSYEYKPKYWSAFKRHSGMPMLSKGARVALSSVGAAFIVAGGLFFGLRNPESASTHKVQSNESFSNNTLNDQIVTIDSSDNNEINSLADAPVSSPITQSKSSKKASKASHTTKVNTQDIAPKASIEKAKHHQSPVFVNGHATVITIDSNESNDFPEYKTSTDPLP